MSAMKELQAQLRKLPRTDRGIFYTNSNYRGSEELVVHGETARALKWLLDNVEELAAACSEAPATHPAVDIDRFPIGTRVHKVGGYPFPGEIRAAFTTTEGNERFVVEASGRDYAGMLHIFNGGQLRAVKLCGLPDCNCSMGAQERCSRAGGQP